MKHSTRDKAIGILSENSRISTKQLGRRLRTSQQAASYHVSRIIESDHARPLLLADSSRLGQVQILFGFVTRLRQGRSTQVMLRELREDPLVTTILIGQFGFDLILEYSAQTVSAINKRHLDLLARHSELLETKFVAPVIVKRWYGRSRLRTPIILAGDRPMSQLDPLLARTLNLIGDDTRRTIRSIADKLDTSADSARLAMRTLEREKIIRGYTITILPDPERTRTQIFLRFSNEGVGHVETFNELTGQMREVVSVTKVLGEFHAILHVENENAYAVLDQLREKVSIDDAIVMPVREVVRERLFAPI